MHDYQILDSISDIKTVGDKIRYHRLIKGLKQKDIYEKVGIDKSTYLQYEKSNTINFNIKTIEKICDVLGIEPSTIYDDYLSFIASDYGTSIKDFRKKNKLTYKKVGESLGMHPRVISRWENGKSVLSRKSYEKLKELFIQYDETI